MNEVALFTCGTFTPIPQGYKSDNFTPVRYVEGEYYTIDVKHVRNIKHHRKFFALVNLGHHHTEVNLPFDAYREYITIKAGFGTMYETPEGYIMKAKSIRFDRMDQAEFSELYSRVLDVIIADIGVSGEVIEGELINFM